MDVIEALKKELQEGRINVDRLFDVIASLQRLLQATQQQLEAAHKRVEELEKKLGGPPTAKQLADIDDCAKQLDPAMALVNKVFDDMPALNKTLASAGVAYFTVDTNSVPAATFGRGGGQR